MRAGGVEAWAASGDVAEDDKAKYAEYLAEYAAEHPEDAKPSSPRLEGDEAAGEAGEDAEDAMDVDEPIAEGNTNSGDQQDAPSPDDDAESADDVAKDAEAAADEKPRRRPGRPSRGRGRGRGRGRHPPRGRDDGPARRASRRRAGARSARESRPARLGISQWAAALLCFGARSRSGSSAPWRTSRATAGS